MEWSCALVFLKGINDQFLSILNMACTYSAIVESRLLSCVCYEYEVLYYQVLYKFALLLIGHVSLLVWNKSSLKPWLQLSSKCEEANEWRLRIGLNYD